VYNLNILRIRVENTYSRPKNAAFCTNAPAKLRGYTGPKFSKFADVRETYSKPKECRFWAHCTIRLGLTQLEKLKTDLIKTCKQKNRK